MSEHFATTERTVPVLARPPTARLASRMMTSTRSPAPWIVLAAHRPANPAPTITRRICLGAGGSGSPGHDERCFLALKVCPGIEPKPFTVGPISAPVFRNENQARQGRKAESAGCMGSHEGII